MRTILSTAIKAGNTSTTCVGKVIGEPKDDGSLPLTVVPLIIKTDSEGMELTREWGSTNIELTLSPAQFAGISAIVKAAYDAQVAGGK